MYEPQPDDYFKGLDGKLYLTFTGSTKVQEAVRDLPSAEFLGGKTANVYINTNDDVVVYTTKVKTGDVERLKYQVERAGFNTVVLPHRVSDKEGVRTRNKCSPLDTKCYLESLGDIKSDYAYKQKQTSCQYSNS